MKKQFLLAVILIAVFSLPAFADDCGTKYRIRTATVLDETIYRVERWDDDGVYYISETSDLKRAILERDLAIESCRIEIKMKEREKAMKDAEWKVIE